MWRWLRKIKLEEKGKTERIEGKKKDEKELGKLVKTGIRRVGNEGRRWEGREYKRKKGRINKKAEDK